MAIFNSYVTNYQRVNCLISWCHNLPRWIEGMADREPPDQTAMHIAQHGSDQDDLEAV